MTRSRSRAAAAVAGVAALSGLALTLLLPPTRLARAADAPAGADAAAGVRKAADEYAAAMSRGDPDAVLAFWAADADYVDAAGTATRGREALGKRFAETLPRLKGSRVSAAINALKLLRPDVILEDGTLTVTAPDGTRESNRYAVVWVKSEGKWLISSARDLSAETADASSLAYPHLKPLEWLVGEWADAKAGVRMTCRWDANKAFLLMQYEVKQAGQEALAVSQRVGWDGHNELVRSWVFDSAGGFGEGYWQRDGNRWRVGTSGVLPDGGTGGATNEWEYVDENTFVWRSREREVDGQPVADAEVRMTRKAAAD
jgi:uncharacterized protein (TIGR02246 family)